MLNPNISVPAALIGEPTRAALLMALCDGRAHAAGALASALNISPQSTSNHLGRLVDGGLLTVVQQGRHRYFRLASPSVAQSIEVLATIATPIRRDRLDRSQVDKEICVARRCYSHLAGTLGVELMEALLRKNYLLVAAHTPAGRIVYRLSEGGLEWAERSGLHLPEMSNDSDPQFAISCLDWTERRDHLSGVLGVRLLKFLIDTGAVKKGLHSRGLIVTAKGISFFLRELDIDLRRSVLCVA